MKDNCMAKEYELINSAELSARIRGEQNGGAKIVLIQMDLQAYQAGKFGNSDPSSLADVIYRQEGKQYAVVRNRIPPTILKRRIKIDD